MHTAIHRTAFSLILAGALSLSAWAEPVAPISGRIEAAGITRVMTVSRIDHETRKIALRSDTGDEAVFVAGPEVRNLAQIDAGDRVTITYAEALAVRVYPVTPGAKGRVETKEVSRAPLGAKPYGQVTRRVELTGKVAELDRERRVVTLEGKQGSLTLRVADDVDLTGVLVGDTVRADYLERVTISVDAAPKKN